MQEYEYLITAHAVEMKPEIAEATSDELSEALTTLLGQHMHGMVTGTQAIQTGDWQLISHEVTILGRHLVLSLLFHRHKQSNT